MPGPAAYTGSGSGGRGSGSGFGIGSGGSGIGSGSGFGNMDRAVAAGRLWSDNATSHSQQSLHRRHFSHR